MTTSAGLFVFRLPVGAYDVTVEVAVRPEAYDCKWGARGINADVLHQLESARSNAATEEAALAVAGRAIHV